MNKFKVLYEDGDARVGVLKTRHGEVTTPFYMPVATKATIKNMSPEMVKELGTECIIANSFVLSLKPGEKVIKEFGGLHKFMKWDGGVFTDSGGFQASSESFFISTKEEGIKFRNPFNGKINMLTPEESMRIQEDIGSDVAMCLDDMPHPTAEHKKVKESVRRTHAWASRCLDSKKDKKQMLFGISQGGVYKDLREDSAKTINDMDFDGLAIGGLAIGETKHQMYEAMDASLPFYDKNRPRYLMGVGTPDDQLKSISKGIDCFDSVFPTQTGRHGGLLTFNGKINIDNAVYKLDKKPIEKGCDCYTCKNYSRAYVNHLLRVKENFGLTLVTIHNIRFMQRHIHNIREAIKKQQLKKYEKEFLKKYIK